MQKIRTFIAIPIPDRLEQAFEELLREMRCTDSGVHWVKPASIHLTLKFLGEITPQSREAVFAAVESAVAGRVSFELHTAGPGAFPSLRHPKVFWIGLQPQNLDPLNQLQADIETHLADRGFPREARTFKPHLTVGRVKSPRNLEKIAGQFGAYPFPNVSIPVREILVMKSELTRQGAMYSVQKAFPLEG